MKFAEIMDVHDEAHIIHSWYAAKYKAGEIIVMDRVQEYMDGPWLLRMRLSELVPLVRVELGWGLASLLLLHSLA